MQKSEASNLVANTLSRPFSRDDFSLLVKNIFKKIEEDSEFKPMRGTYIRAAFRSHIKKYERLGKYKDKDGRSIDILIVHLEREGSLERARTMQRNFVAWYLNGGRGGILRDAALVAFVAPDETDWRFSLVKMEYKEFGKSKELSPARRYSYPVGIHEKTHTAQRQLLPLLTDDKPPRLDDLISAFNVERVGQEFFERYKDLFLGLKESIDQLIEHDLKIAKDFKAKEVNSVDFSKKLLGQIVFLYFLQKKGWFGVKRGQPWGSGSKNFLRELLEKKHGDYENFYNDILEPLFYEALRLERPEDYYSRFDCRIPFLNGGLFDPLGEYDWVDTDVLMPNELFSNTKTNKDGDVGTGILDVFDRYNFTVKEDEPLEKEVAVDPEMLGKVFENLLEVKDRKSAGTYYTPRQVVHYMCQESLVNYLSQEVEDASKDDIRTLVEVGDAAVEHETIASERTSYAYKLPESVRKNAKQIDDKLSAIRICDPAVGSGAFPVGMMSEIVRTRSALVPHLPKANEKTAYDFKWHAIRNSLYGVDIDAGATEIAKLRLWLSLIVDEEDIHNIKPLPNLDFKIVQGNSLMSIEPNLLNQKLFSDLEELKPKFFEESGTRKKQSYKQQIDEIIDQITEGKKLFDFEVYFSEVFHEKKGFDVVIANPPYISHDKLDDKDYLKKSFKAFEPFADIYCYFIEQAIRIQRKGGTLCFITSNSYLRSDYGFPIRGLLRNENSVVQLINLHQFQVFKDALVNVAVLISEKAEFRQPALIVNAKINLEEDFATFVSEHQFKYEKTDLAEDPWTLVHVKALAVKKKIKDSHSTLEESGTKIRMGIATGYNEAFLIDEDKKRALIKADRKNTDLIKPILRGRDISRWVCRKPHLYVILAKNGINIPKDYPTIEKHFQSFGEKFRKRGAKGNHWTNLRATAFLDDFKREKIIWIELSEKGRFAISTEECYLLNSAYFLVPPKNLSVKYLLAVLNSRIIHFYMHCIAETSGAGVTRWINNFVKEFPIAVGEEMQVKNIEKLVDQIISEPGNAEAIEGRIDKVVGEIYGLTSNDNEVIERELAG